MKQLDTKYTCSTCGYSFIHKAGSLMIAVVPIHCGVVMRATTEPNKKPYEITYTRTQTLTVTKEFASLEDAKRYADDPRASDGSCILDGAWDEIDDTYDIEEVRENPQA